MGYEVHCAANANHTGADDVVDFLKEHGVHYHQIDFSSNKPISLKTAKSLLELLSLSRKVDFDFVHCHTPIAGAICRLVFLRKQRNKQIKLAYTTHGFYFHKLSSQKTWLLFFNIEKFLSRFTDVVITINHEDFNNAKKMHCKNIRYIPGVGVNLKRFHDVNINTSNYRLSLGLSDKDFVILAVGEISKRKNHKVVVEALSKAKISNSILVICGTSITGDKTKQELEYLAENYGVRVKFLGLRKDIPEICKCADIGVLPSTREGLGLAGIEMLASGLPVIGSNVQGIPDYIRDNVNGILCNPYSSDDFCNAILCLFNKKNRAYFAANTWESVQQFSLEHSQEEMKKIYSDILRNESD